MKQRENPMKKTISALALAAALLLALAGCGAEPAAADAFLDYMKDKTVGESHRQSMMDEDCLDMFVNYQGICVGETGEVWLSDPNLGTDAEPVLEIIAINGVISR